MAQFNKYTMAELTLQDRFLLDIAHKEKWGVEPKLTRTLIKQRAINYKFARFLQSLFNSHVKGTDREKAYELIVIPPPSNPKI